MCTHPRLGRLVVAGLALLITAVGITGARAMPITQEPGDRSYLFPIQVDGVDVQIRESYPVQVAAAVSGVVGNGCTRFERVDQWHDGETNTVHVLVLGRHSGAEVCTMIARLYSDVITLAGPFPPGDYTVRVNGVTRTFHVD